MQEQDNVDGFKHHDYDGVLKSYIGRSMTFTIGYILDLEKYGALPGYVAFSLLDRR